MIREMPSYKLTVRDFVLAFIESLTDGQATYEQQSGGSGKLVRRLPVVKTLQVTPDVSSKKIFASGLTYDVTNRTKGATMALGAIALPQEVLDKAIGTMAAGKLKVNTTGDGARAKEFGCGYVMEMSDGSSRYYWHPRCKLTPGAENFDDIGDNDVDPNESYTIEVLPTDEGVWKVTYDTAGEETPMTEESFFDATVYSLAEIEELGGVTE